MVHFEKNVCLTDGKGILTTEDLDYDMGQRIWQSAPRGHIVIEVNPNLTSCNRGVYFMISRTSICMDT